METRCVDRKTFAESFNGKDARNALATGDVVVFRNGQIGFVFCEMIVGKGFFTSRYEYSKDLTKFGKPIFSINKKEDYDIVTVYCIESNTPVILYKLLSNYDDIHYALSCIGIKDQLESSTDLKISFEDVKYMTKEQIEVELGYKFQLVE